MKSKGYILFVYYDTVKGFGDTNDCGIETSEYCDTKDQLDREYNNHWDDKWDVSDRNKIHYFYLDLSTMKYTPLPRWKNPPNITDKFKSDEKTILSNKVFK